MVPTYLHVLDPESFPLIFLVNYCNLPRKIQLCLWNPPLIRRHLIHLQPPNRCRKGEIDATLPPCLDIIICSLVQVGFHSSNHGGEAKWSSVFGTCPTQCFDKRKVQIEYWAKMWRTCHDYPLVNVYRCLQFAIENGHRNSGFTHWTWWFSLVFGMFTRAGSRHDSCKICRVTAGYLGHPGSTSSSSSSGSQSKV